ncbi:MAG: PPC domain-containing protein [Anaerolineae bacterium]|nr:PPC domain-containing protein [Anaerolineae bacterium]
MVDRLFPARSGRRLLVALIAVVILITGSQYLAYAQTNPRKLQYGGSATDTLSAEKFAQVYSFDASVGDKVTIVATSQADNLTLGLLLTDATGQVVAQTTDTAAKEARLADVTIPTAGTHYITVARGGDGEGNFELSLTGTSAAAPSTVEVSGIEVNLAWASSDDFNLEVRDPRGGAVNFRTPSVQSGGRLAQDVNGSCVNTTSQNPNETISWPAGNVPGGSYEVIVYYNQACAQPAAPRSFTLTITVNGTALAPITSTLRADQQYVTSFVIASPTNVTVGQGGDPLEAALNLIAYRDEILSPRTLNNNQGVSTITNTNPVDAWSFQGEANEVVSVDMIASSGSLDTFLILIGPTGIPVASNDDANANTRNSTILNFQLPAAGNYVVLATRFGLQLGGTEGSYTLTVTRGGGTVNNVVNTPVPGATAIALPTTAAGTTVDANNDGLPDGIIEMLLRWDTRADLRLLVRDPQGRVLYADNPRPLDGGILEQQGNLNCTNTVNTPQTYAYWPGTRINPGVYEVQVWVASDCSDQIQPNFSLGLKVNNKEVTTVQNRPDFGVRHAHYVFAFTVADNGDATASEGGIFYGDFALDIGSVADKLTSAQLLEYGRPVTGTLDGTTPFVIYTFNANKGDQIRLSLRTIRGTLDPFMYLLDGAGQPVTQNDDVVVGRDINSRIDYEVQVSGTYTVIATRYGAGFGGTTGTYEMSLALRR